MKDGKRNSKALLVGIFAAVLVLAGLLVLLLTQCTGGQETAATTAAPTTEPQVCDIYWNMDRQAYDGKSEAGMSSRVPEDDGYWHIRFFLDGQEVTLKTATRKIVNAIDVNYMMGLEFDEQGLITGVVPIDELPVQEMGWQFYVQSVGRNVIKLNSSNKFNGMEVMLEDVDPDRIWDMTGLSGPIGCVTEPIKWDRVMALADLEGNVTHVFIYDRSNFMLTHEGECPHCKETVTWSEWTKTDTIPEISGHFQLQNDITLNGQASPGEDVKLCLDLNGHRIDGKKDSRVVIMNNPSIELAVMDTSEGQTGVIAAHGKGTMGMAIMVRNGALHLYSGTIDASDAENTNGGAVSVSKNCFAYMYGGKIIGGEAKPVQNASTGAYESGAGGSLYVSGKFVMHDGIVENGRATSVITYNKEGNPVYNRGMGGNIYVASGGEFEMNGGVVRGGRAGLRGGNIGADGAAVITVNGGTVSGGYVSGDNCCGGNIYGSSKVTITVNGGTVSGGTTRGHSGNIYSTGLLNINGGRIVGGLAYDAKTGKLKTTATHHNIYVVDGKLKIWGGYIQGGLNVIDTSATDNKQASVSLNGAPRITDGPNGLDLSIANNRVLVHVGTLYQGAKIGVNAKHGIFSQPTKAENADKFYSNVQDAQVVHYEECLGVGRIRCLCGKQDHGLGCDGKLLFWAPHSASDTLPTAEGNYYLTQDVVAKKGFVVTPGADVKLDLGGHNITYQVQPYTTAGMRLYRSDNASVLTLTDTTDAPGTVKAFRPTAGTPYTGSPLLKAEVDGEKIYFEPGSAEEQAEAERLWAQGDYGTLLWARGGEINIINGIFDGSNITGTREQGGMVIYVATSTATDEVTGEKTVYPAVLNLYGGTIKGGQIHAPGNIAIKEGTVLNMYGGTIEGGKANMGGALYISGKATIHGGTVSGGEAVTPAGVDTTGGNIYISSTGELTVEGGTITGGKGELGGNIFAYGSLTVRGGLVEKGEASKCGGNIGTNAAKSSITVEGEAIIRDGKAPRGGNLALYVRGNQGFTVGGQAQILNGEATTGGGNIFVASWLDEPAELQLTGGLVSGGKAPMGGNVYVAGSSSGCHATFTATGGTIEKGNSTNGANLAVDKDGAVATLKGVAVHNTTENAYNILVNAGTLHIQEGTRITNEAAGASNIQTSNETDTVSVVSMTGGTVSGGKNSNVRLYSGDTFEMSGGTVMEGSAARGGNIYAEGTTKADALVIISGGAVEKGSTTENNTGANIRLNNGNAKLTVDGAVIPGGIHANATATVTLKNSAQINKGDSGCAYSLRMGGNARLILDEFTGGQVYVTGTVGSTLAQNVTTDLSAYILTEVPETQVVWNEGAKNLVLKAIKNTYCTCGASKDVAYECHCLDADQGELAWQAWDGVDALPTATGNYYLTDTVDLATVATPEADAVIRIDLRGKKILLKDAEDLYSFAGVSGVRLVITDSSANPGSVILTGTDTATGGILKLVGSNSFVLYRATLDASGFNSGSMDGGNVYVGSGASFTLCSGQLLGHSGSRVLLVNGTADLLGGTVSGGAMNIRLNNAGAKVKLSGATVSNAVANGVNVRVDVGELTVEEGSLITNTAAGGTNVATTNSGTSAIIMTGGTISGGKNSNVRLLHGDSFTMSGGLITGGSAANGGNVYVEGTSGADATMTITGGTIEKGSTTNSRTGANIRLNNGNAKLTVDGATIPGGIHVNSTASLTLKNAPVIDKGESGLDYSVRMGNSAKLTVTEMTGGLVYIYTDNDGKVIAENVATDLSAYFQSDRSAYEVVYTDQTLVYHKK